MRWKNTAIKHFCNINWCEQVLRFCGQLKCGLMKLPYYLRYIHLSIVYCEHEDNNCSLLYTSGIFWWHIERKTVIVQFLYRLILTSNSMQKQSRSKTVASGRYKRRPTFHMHLFSFFKKSLLLLFAAIKVALSLLFDQNRDSC